MVMMSAYKKEFKEELDNSDQNFDFMEKPFEIDDLLQLLNEVSKKRLMKALV
jgi:DNA-binding NtrC family response regulator